MQSPVLELLSFISKFKIILAFLLGVSKALMTYLPVHNSLGLMMAGGGNSINSVASEKAAQNYMKLLLE